MQKSQIKHIAQHALKEVQGSILKLGTTKARTVTIRVNKDKIKPDTFQHELQRTSAETDLRNTQWIIQEMKARAHCKSCKAQFEFSSKRVSVTCPYCSSSNIKILDQEFFELTGVII